MLLNEYEFFHLPCLFPSFVAYFKNRQFSAEISTPAMAMLPGVS